MRGRVLLALIAGLGTISGGAPALASSTTTYSGGFTHSAVGCNSATAPGWRGYDVSCNANTSTPPLFYDQAADSEYADAQGVLKLDVSATDGSGIGLDQPQAEARATESIRFPVWNSFNSMSVLWTIQVSGLSATGPPAQTVSSPLDADSAQSSLAATFSGALCDDGSPPAQSSSPWSLSASEFGTQVQPAISAQSELQFYCPDGSTMSGNFFNAGLSALAEVQSGAGRDAATVDAQLLSISVTVN